MAIVVETGTGASTSQSYLSVADCDAYNLLHSNDATWIAASTASKEIALIRATQYLDSNWRNRWNGVRIIQTQALAWPRSAVIDYDGYEYASNALPQALKDATAECAVRFATASMIPDVTNSGNMQSITVGPISTTYAGGRSVNTMYQLVEALLRDLVVAGGVTSRG